jgi:hypothetical protein
MERYFMMIYFKGYYNANFEPYFRSKQSLTTNTVYIYPKTTFYSSDMRVLVFDNEKDIIVYYNKKYSKNTDPRIIEQVKKMTLGILQPLYYK